jgi:glycosyltransferase involved in cell wall biosynthesis
MQGIDKLYISRLDDELSATADLVLYVNSAMWEEGRKRNPNSLLLGHGVDYTYFADACISDTVPEDIATIGHPVVGFFGDITEDVCDFSLLGYVAEKMPDVSIVLVGPISSDLSSLRKYSNLHFLGQKPYDVIAHYGKMFDVAIMPWKRNKWIEFCNPVKTKEYLALGKPIVSIDYPELRPFHDLVYPASDYDGFVQAIRRALGEDDETLVQKRRERVQHETWDDKVGQIEEFISKNVQRKNSDK